MILASRWSLLLFGPLCLASNGCSLLWDWGHRAALRRDIAGLLERHSVQGRVRDCAMEGMTRTGACLWEAQGRDMDDLVRACAMEEKAPQDDRERWRGVSRCRRLARDPRTRAHGVFSGAAAWRLSSGQFLERLVLFVPADSGPACLQASYAKP